jgi:hypothetical protein
MDPDDLYGLPLDRFVPERGALAKALRADGRREEAEAVGRLRKPSVAAWAVNQLVRTQRQAVQELFDAGHALREAQARLIAGRGDARELRAAGERERIARDRLVDTARGLLTSEGHELSAAVVDRVADTLHAAALDEPAREQVRDGRLDRELRHAGLGFGEGAALPPAPRARAGKQKAARADEAKAARADEAKAARADEAKAARAAQAKAARAAEAAARRSAERAARALRVAEERRARAADALAQADLALASARHEAEAAAGAHGRAQAELEDS